jgi:hypothetical protein
MKSEFASLGLLYNQSYIYESDQLKSMTSGKLD